MGRFNRKNTQLEMIGTPYIGWNSSTYSKVQFLKLQEEKKEGTIKEFFLSFGENIRKHYFNFRLLYIFLFIILLYTVNTKAAFATGFFFKKKEIIPPQAPVEKKTFKSTVKNVFNKIRQKPAKYTISALVGVGCITTAIWLTPQLKPLFEVVVTEVRNNQPLRSFIPALYKEPNIMFGPMTEMSSLQLLQNITRKTIGNLRQETKLQEIFSPHAQDLSLVQELLIGALNLLNEPRFNFTTKALIDAKKAEYKAIQKVSLVLFGLTQNVTLNLP